MVDLDRREPEPGETGHGARLAHKPGERVAVLAVAIAPEVDARKNDLPMSLLHALTNLGQDSVGSAAPGGTTHLRNDAEPAREAAAVLDLDEGSDAVEADRSVRAPSTPTSADTFSAVSSLGAETIADVVGQPGELVTRQVRRAPGHVDPPGAARRAPDGLSRLSHRLMRDTARVHDRHVGLAGGLSVSVRREPLTQCLGIGVRHLAAEELDGEGRHRWAILAAVWGR